MKSIRLVTLTLFVFLFSFSCFAHETGRAENSYATYAGEKEKNSGWFIGTDQGVLLFVGNSSNLVNPQYYGTQYGGYNVQGIFQPMLRIGQALGSLNQFGNASTFFFTLEGGIRVTPIRTKVRPYFLGTAGMYILNLSGPYTTVQSGTNLTYSGGGGLEVQFGSNRFTLGSAYRGFVNGGPDLKSVEITLGYIFQF